MDERPRTRQIAPMLYRLATAALVTLALMGCGQGKEPPAPAQAEASNGSDAFSNTIEEAMCGKPDQRASAISDIASNPEFSSQSQDVYDQATDIAGRGCPKPVS